MLSICLEKLKIVIGGGQSVFDSISYDDLIMAFFPCIYFTGYSNPLYFRLDCVNYSGLSLKEKFDRILQRADDRNYFYKLLYKLCGICIQRGIRLILENPFSTQHYLNDNFLQQPSLIDKNRTLRGDCFKKPTGYWFFNCKPTYGISYQRPKEIKIIANQKSGKAGVCSQERSMIEPDYARNFICDFILGKVQNDINPTLFNLNEEN